jgi:hypothetical protein
VTPLDEFKRWADRGNDTLSGLEMYQSTLQKKLEAVKEELEQVTTAIALINRLKETA